MLNKKFLKRNFFIFSKTCYNSNRGEFMKTITYNEENYELMVYQTNIFKTSTIDIVFNIPNTKEDITNIVYLKKLITLSGKHYPRVKDKNIMLEKLYNAYLGTSLEKNANCITLTITLSIINDSYTEKDNMRKAILFLFDILNNPNITADGYDSVMFNIIKKEMLDNIKTFNENPNRVSFRNLINNIDPDSYMACQLIGTEEQVKKVTPKSIAKYYKDFINRAACKVFAVGDFNPDVLNDLIKSNNHFNNNPFNECIIKPLNIKSDLQLDIIEESNFEQSILHTYLKKDNIDFFKAATVGSIFNNIFGDGSMSNKLFMHLREENSLCYSISSSAIHSLNSYVITAGIDAKNFKKATSLIKQSLIEMQEGKFTQKDIESAKKQLLFSLSMRNDSVNSIINNLENRYIYNRPDLDEIEKKISEVTKEEIVAYANEITIVNNYLLKESGGEK